VFVFIHFYFFRIVRFGVFLRVDAASERYRLTSAPPSRGIGIGVEIEYWRPGVSTPFTFSSQKQASQRTIFSIAVRDSSYGAELPGLYLP
jgi:hypothetical protein